MKKCSRGFNIYSEFKDTHGNTVTVKESSAAMKHCVWIFVKNKNGADGVWDNATGQYISASPHLSKAQAKRLAKALLKFAEGD